MPSLIRAKSDEEHRVALPKIKSKLLAQEQRVGGTQGLSQILTGSDCYFYTTPFRASFSHPMTMYHGSGFEGANIKP